MTKTLDECVREIVDRLPVIETAIRQLYELESRFKPASFERTPMPELQAVLTVQGTKEVMPTP